MAAPDLERFDLEAVRRQAQASLPPPLWDFIDGGALDEETMAANERRFARYYLRPSVFTGVSTPSSAVDLLGLELSMPILIAPFAGDGLLHRAGFPAVARAADRAGTAAIVPELTSMSLEDIAQAAPQAVRLFQMTPFGTPEQFLRLADRAAGAGYRAICMTSDVAAGGIRRRNLQHTFDIQEALPVANWVIDGAIDPAQQFRNFVRRQDPDWTWAVVADVVARCPLPVVVKGIMTGRDAQAAVAAGAAGVYVSNHGGRQLDGVAATIDVLEEVVAAVGGAVPVLLDGGVRSGTDVVRALALGAAAVGIGRPVAWGLAAGGEEGVLHVLRLLQHEVETALTLLGCETVADLDRSHVGTVAL